MKTKAASLLPLAWLACLNPATVAAESCPALDASHVQVGGRGFRVEVAASNAAREKGLSRRPVLATEAGMLFVLPAPGFHGFWMKDMAFPIDLIWISPDRVVLGAQRLTPCTAQSCPIHYPPGPAAYVLEVNAGRFAGKVGDRVVWRCATAPDP